MLFNFSWVIPGKLAGSNLPGRSLITGRFVYLDMIKDLVEIKEKGIKVVASVIDTFPREFKQECDRNDLTNLHFIIEDYYVPNDMSIFKTYIELLIDCINEKKPVLCHCAMGVGRTGLTLACIVGKLNNLNSEEAIKFVRSTRPHSIENNKQIDFVQRFLDGELSETKHRGVLDI